MENNDFEKLYQEYVHEVFRFILRLSGNYQVAEEITQEIFLRAYTSLNEFRGDCQLKVWLCQIGKNLFFDYLKKTRNCIPLENLEENYFNGEQSSLTDNLISKEKVLQLKQLIYDLKEPYQTVLIQRIFLELSYSEIGEQLGRTENWVRVNFYRAKKKLQHLIKEMEDIENEM